MLQQEFSTERLELGFRWDRLLLSEVLPVRFLRINTKNSIPRDDSIGVRHIGNAPPSILLFLLARDVIAKDACANTVVDQAKLDCDRVDPFSHIEAQCQP